jgi:hypothetical protein
MQFRVVLEKRVLGETGFFLFAGVGFFLCSCFPYGQVNTFLYRQQSAALSRTPLKQTQVSKKVFRGMG